MINFENQICDACGKSFDKDSDIVVCPICGTPHHRSCWMERGNCVNRDKHRSGFEWKPTAKMNSAESVKCENCGSVNLPGSLFCENCGKELKPVLLKEIVPDKTYEMPGGGRVQVHKMPTAGGENFSDYVNRQFTGEVDGISMKDVAAFIGMNAQYYAFKFRRMDSDPNYKPFNVSAFLFAPFWFMLRKMWKMALITAVRNFVTGIPTRIITLVERGLISSSYMFTGIETASSILTVVNLIINLIFGFMAVPMFRKDTVRRLNELKAKSGGDDRMYYNMLLQQSGPSKAGMFITIFFVSLFLFTM